MTEITDLLDYYNAKLNENLALIYSDVYFYKTSKGHMEKAAQINEKHDFLKPRAMQFKLKHANFHKKSGFYAKCE